ncbi:hypothetical protein E2C01_007430 [Portunus trituberculatus]|uniref:Thyroglobulin type-1 domain-containing protein n=1 Tax=Portunus trituberculatus TaxID=210409 RepID=A0A5B7CZ06_PORTR|nr:hypothetical protein [Portunus trituberculatus]
MPGTDDARGLCVLRVSDGQGAKCCGAVLPPTAKVMSGREYIAVLTHPVLCHLVLLKLCMYVKCQEPFDATGCQKDSVYLEGAGQFGCCGACVTFKKSGESDCTGSIDPAYSGGYAAPRGALWSDMRKDLEWFGESNNTVFSSWCDYGLACNYDNVCEPECARQVWERQQAGESSITLHCMENGNYEALQCEDGWCYCVHPESGDPYGTMIPEEVMHLLPCYNITLVGEQYLRRCESMYEAEDQLTEHMLAKGVHGPTGLYKCDPDGSFSGEQCIHGHQKNSHVNLECATPAGLDSGLYYPYQYYGDMGVYCVDQDGIRSSPMLFESATSKSKFSRNAFCTGAGWEACIFTLVCLSKLWPLSDQWEGMDVMT